MCILDLSTTLIYDFHYNNFKTKYGDDYSSPTQTISHIKLRLKIGTLDISSDVEKLFNTIDYPTNHPSGIKIGVNCKVLRKFKDETVSSKQ